MWSISAALGLGTLMLANIWLFEFIRYLGALYLIYLAINAGRSALSKKHMATRSFKGSWRALYVKGLALHLTNPKAILFFGSLYSLGMPVKSTPQDLLLVIIAVGVQSCVIFHAYALLFSSKPVSRGYLKLRRWFDGLFALAFGAASIKILTAKIQAP